MICHDHDLFPENLEAMLRGGVTAKQVHICLDALYWAERETFLGSADLEEGFLRRALVAMDYLYWQVERSGGQIRVVLEPEDILRAKEEGAIALLLGAEGARLLENRLEVLRMLYRLGLRHLQLSWAWRSAVGAPQRDKSGRGLTAFGRSLIREMNRLGMIVDISHLAYRAQYEALETSASPVLNSHTGAATLSPEWTQMLPDDLIRAIASQGGVIGIHFMSHVVKPGWHQATLDELMDQFEYVTNLVGVDHVACGPDYLYLDPRVWENQDAPAPFSYTAGVEDISHLESVTRGLVSRGFSDGDIGKIMGANLLRLFSTVRREATLGAGAYMPFARGIGACTDGTTPL
ncbi:MAG TPA: membrane dipeptidase [Anaerolineae bacterium]|nr:membrane dipeptidase [Anaerolineae bacterium]HOQ98606.1 membrane dipeptidase [Anaerolineae bacterium]HPL28767.1 membrane dipeptidase [Anaerolineae bacterium]